MNLLIAALLAAANPSVTDTSFVAPDGARTLQQSIVIDAAVPVLWRAFTDAREFQRWSAPVAAIDLKTGGSLEATYDDKHAIGDPDNIRHRIVTYLPNRLIVFQNTNAPAGLPGRELFKQVVAVLEYEALAPNRTKVTLSQTGWGTDPASDTLYRFFQSGNAASLAKMKRVYEAPPTAGSR